MTTTGQTVGSCPPAGTAARDWTTRANQTLATSLRLLRAYGRDDVADLVRSQAQLPATTPRVVVVGETKRGKSSLVNAMFDDPALAPVGAEETTATYLSFVPLRAGEPGPRAEVLNADGTRVPIELDKVPDHVDLTRLPAAAPALPLSVEVHRAPGLLGPVVVADTPGIGGIGGVRGRLSRRLAGETGCLLFLLDAGSPMSSVELDYLERCAVTVENVIIGVTMIDKYPQTWREIVDAVRRTLARRSPRLQRFPVVGLSAHAALAARAAPTAVARDALMAASGLPDLVHHIHHIDRRALHPSVNALRTSRTAVEQILRAAQLRAKLLAEEPEAGREVDQRRAELDRLRTHEQRWALDLDRDLGRLRADVARELARRLDALAEGWRARIEKTPLLGRAAYVRSASLDMAAEYLLLRQDLAGVAAQRLSVIVDGLFAGSTPPEVAMALGDPKPEERQLGEGSPTKVDWVDPGMIMAGSMGVGLAAKIATLAVLGPAAVPLAVAGAGAWIAFNYSYRSNRLDRQTLAAELARTMAAERTAVMDQLDGRIREVRPELVVAYRAHLKSSATSLQQLVREAERSRESGQAARDRVVAEAREAIMEIRDVLRAVDDVLAVLHG